MHEQVVRQVRNLAIDTCDIHDDFRNDDDLFAKGLVRSIHLLDLIISLEDTFFVKVNAQDMLRGTLRSVASIARWIQACKAQDNTSAM